MKRVVVIINKESSRAIRHLEQIEGELSSRFKLTHYEVVNSKSLPKAFSNAVKKKPDTVLIGGGDGTIIEAINYFVKHGYKGAFGIVPLGTSNYLARNLKIPISLSGSLDKIAKGREKLITLPEVNGKSFALMTMIGISTEISDNVEVSLKQKLGQFAYIIETFKHLRHHESFNYRIEINGGEKILRGSSHQIAITNSDLSQQLKIIPSSRLDHRHMRLTVYGTSGSVLKLILSVLVYVFTLGNKKVGLRTLKVKSVNIQTTPNKKYATDGEVWGKTPLTVKMGNKTVKILC